MCTMQIVIFRVTVTSKICITEGTQNIVMNKKLSTKNKLKLAVMT